MKCVTQIDVLHLWELNRKYRRDKLIMIFLYIIYLLDRKTAADSKAEYAYKKIICWLIINKPKPTTPLFGAHLPWSRRCPLLK